jgi:tetratricopeptide (TPR) repeat protein
LDEHLSAATTNFRLALQLADRDTAQSDVNLVRYFLCYLYYLRQQPYESALIGDFVSQRYPDSAGALQCAKISLACYLTLFAANEGQDRSFEIERLVAVANHIADRWPGGDAEQSLSTLVPHMVNAGELEQARQLTERIAETSPERGKAELVSGQAYWGAAARAAQQIYEWQQQGAPDGIDLALQQALLEELQQSARELLSAGFKRLPQQPGIDTATATALLSLARAYVTAEDYAAAIEVLEHPQFGPLTLVQQRDSAVDNPALTEETYRTALQASIGSLGTGGDAVMEKARQLMTALQNAVGDDAAGRQRLLSVYTSLALSIEAQMKSAPPETKQQMSLVFESFLQQLAAGATDPGILNWVAETYAGIAAGFDDGSGFLSDDAKKYYENARAAFANLLAAPNVPSQTATQIQLRMATMMVQLRDFNGALAVIQRVLADNANALNVQAEAARTLQKWGSEDPQKYAQAIAGMDTPQSKIWGWGKIAAATQSHQQFRETFYESRYELARCQFDLAQSKSGTAKDKLIAAAERTLVMTKQLYPTLGGPRWTRRYNELLNPILAAQGKPPIKMMNTETSLEVTP